VDLKDKIIDSREAAHAELQQREERQRKDGKDSLPTPVVEAIQEASRQQRTQLLGAIRMILGHERLDIGELRMPPRETQALEALQVAVDGKSSHLYQFVYASDRRDLLERALGVLQPDLTRTDDKTARELQAQLDDLSQRLADLRHRLSSLEDSQDELMRHHEAAEIVAAPGDKPKPKPPTTPSDPDAPRPPTTLTGPELPAARPAPSTLTGPELPADRPVPSTLTGPELPADRPVPSTLTGPELPEAPPAPSALVADDAAAGDPPGGTPKRPWWRRPFG
jgi:hypothetical protein